MRRRGVGEGGCRWVSWRSAWAGWSTGRQASAAEAKQRLGRRFRAEEEERTDARARLGRRKEGDAAGSGARGSAAGLRSGPKGRRGSGGSRAAQWKRAGWAGAVCWARRGGVGRQVGLSAGKGRSAAGWASSWVGLLTGLGWVGYWAVSFLFSISYFNQTKPI